MISILVAPLGYKILCLLFDESHNKTQNTWKIIALILPHY